MTSVRDLRVHPTVAALLPADLLAALRHGPHPSTYRCPVCEGEGDLAMGEATSLVLRRYPHRFVRRVQLVHAECAPSTVTVAPAALAEEELAASGSSIVYADLLGIGTAALTGCRPQPLLAVDDDDDLMTTDPRAPGDPCRLRPGEVIDPAVSHALATGLALHSSLRDDPPFVAGWTVRIGPALLDLVHPRADGRQGIERLNHTIPAEWRAAVRAAGNQVTLLVGRMGLSTAVRAPYLPARRPRAPIPPSPTPTGHHPAQGPVPAPAAWHARPRVASATSPAATFAVLSAVSAGRVAAGRVTVTWAGPD
ncbi:MULTISPECIES: hypothetical protein [unclassified Pseudofrankia]|uniref:hypothetical protein n=1 Tax=unclassified Pseudofrankia TaxID=2994372 RepID=UPI0009F42F40|nr:MULTISPECIES: hypothetical protein [unclassified Pseudofrankia]MDT3439132.1 hypothetical protein [Pseudofrankia sp. BMG5.37]